MLPASESVGAMSRARVTFRLAVASTAAALAGPCVEGLSNRGAFGPGRWTDHSNADVVPVLCLGLIFCCAFVIALARGAAAPSRTSQWLRDAPRGASFAPTFALQIATLFGMETVEQVLVWGRPLGGTVWLGGPLPVSLAIHALMCLIVGAVFARVLRRLAGHVAHVLRIVGRLTLALSPAPPPLVVIPHPALRRLAEDIVRRRNGRAPPHHLLRTI